MTCIEKWAKVAVLDIKRSQEYLLVKFLQMIIKANVGEFIFSKALCFQHILLNTLRQMPRKYEDYPFRDILF